MVDPKGQLYDAVAQTNPFGLRREIGENQFRRRAEAITGQKMMLDKPRCPISELISQDHLLDGLIISASNSSRADIARLDFVKDAQIHALSSPFCSQIARSRL